MPDRERCRRGGDEQQPGGERPFRAGPPPDQPCDGAGEEQRHRARQQVEPCLRRAGVEAIVDEALHVERQPVRNLDEVRHEHERAEHCEAGDERRQVREQHLPHGEHAHVHHRLGNAQLGDRPGDEEDEGEDRERERGAGRPAPVLPLCQSDKHADEPA